MEGVSAAAGDQVLQLLEHRLLARGHGFPVAAGEGLDHGTPPSAEHSSDDYEGTAGLSPGVKPRLEDPHVDCQEQTPFLPNSLDPTMPRGSFSTDQMGQRSIP
jgi:hypothetical protein